MKSKPVKCFTLFLIALACILMALPSQAMRFGPEPTQFTCVSYYHAVYMDLSSAGTALGSVVFFLVQALCASWLRTACFSILWLAVELFLTFRRVKRPVTLRFDVLVEAIPAAVLGGVASVSALICVFEGLSLVTGAVALLLVLALAVQVRLDWRRYWACR